MGNMSRNKGARGELEFLKLLQPTVDKVYGTDVVSLCRNLMQTRDGGFDVAGVEWMALEVKRCETLCLSAWWEQTLRQAGNTRLPVLAYRQNNKAWRVRMMMDVGDVQLPCEVSLEDWLVVFEQQLRVELAAQMGGGYAGQSVLH